MSLQWEQVVVDSDDPRSLGRWWAGLLGWEVVNDDADEFEVRPSADQLPGLLFVRVSDAKVGKNRLHLDFRPDDQQAEVHRFVEAGATPVDVGQEDVPWVVLADPEGNEFCILSAPRSTG
jgi:predicted enzyme related to lactoylglutathione lyase